MKINIPVFHQQSRTKRANQINLCTNTLMSGLKNGEKSIRWQECWNGCLNQLNMPDSYPMRIASMEFCTPSFLNRFCR